MSLNPLKPGQLAGKTAFVTGSSRGIGADTVTYFAEAGARVAINYRDKEARAEKVAAGIRENHGAWFGDDIELARLTREPLRGLMAHLGAEVGQGARTPDEAAAELLAHLGR